VFDGGGLHESVEKRETKLAEAAIEIPHGETFSETYSNRKQPPIDQGSLLRTPPFLQRNLTARVRSRDHDSLPR
jgi:hypothetical protein